MPVPGRLTGFNIDMVTDAEVAACLLLLRAIFTPEALEEKTKHLKREADYQET